MKILCFSLVMMALFTDTYCRSLTPKNDVPDPPKKVSEHLPPSAVLPPAHAKSLTRDKAPAPALMKSKPSDTPRVKLNVKEKFTVPVQMKNKSPVSLQLKSTVKVSHKPSGRAPLHVLARIKSTQPVKPQVRANPNPVTRGHTLSGMKAPSNAQTSSKGNILKPVDFKGGLLFLKPGGNNPTEGNLTTTPPQTTTTTVDPWDEYCKEACEAGMAGPECDCAGHPIGKRNAPRLEPDSLVDGVERQPMLQYHPHLVSASLPNHSSGKEVSAKVQ